jgi:AcrR family transcriptional regulator
LPRNESSRREELLERAYRYALEHGLADLSLRPLAGAIGSSPRVLLFLFGSKDGLVRALLARARAEELAIVDLIRPSTTSAGLGPVARELWRWLAAPEHRALLTLWVEGYARSLMGDDGPWANFARSTVTEWLDLLAAAQPPRQRTSRAGQARRTAVLAVLRGATLDLLATGDVRRTTDAVHLAVRDDHPGRP